MVRLPRRPGFFCDEFQCVFSYEDITDADGTFDPDSFDQYLNMELALEREREREILESPQ